MDIQIKYRKLRALGIFLALQVFLVLGISGGLLAQTNGLFVHLTDQDTYEEEEEAEFYLDNIVIKGNKRTKDQIITRELNVEVGESYALKDLKSILEVDRNKIYNTTLFNAVDINIIETVDNRVLIEIVVSERWYLYPIPKLNIVDRNFNDWLVNQGGDLSRIEYGLKLNQYNFRGRNEKLNFLFQLGFTRKFGIGYSIPYIDRNQRVGLSVNYSYSENKNTSYNTIDHIIKFVDSDEIIKRNHSSGVRLTYRNSFFNRHFFDVGFRYTQVGDTVTILNPNYFNNGNTKQRYIALGYSYVSDHRDIVAYPLTGHRFGFSVRKIGIGAFNDVNKLDFNVFYSKYIELPKRFFLSNYSDVYVSFPKNQPYSIINALGFGNKVIRGFELNVVEGQNFFLNKTTFKKELFKTVKKIKAIPLEQFQTFPIAMYLKTYFDFGYASNLLWYQEIDLNERLSDKIIWGTGVGLDIFTTYDMVIRLEYSLNSEMQTGFFFHFKKEF